ncbi:exodeoxyribonuclease VII large subunit [Parvularcula marina]|uniref:exodeoxyribonuclease VII large subunit n=1 Tax=Parvularcula marina TaxID=2292771 RepID=UPI003518738B
MADNVPEYSVTELSGAIKRTMEDAFGYVRVRGELGRVTRAGSGHCYLDLKDERAVLSSVIWKGSWSRLAVKPEQGMEVIATGRLTTFPGQSRYQLVIDQMEPAGAGALMALFEERKKRLEAEGLTASERKRPLPKMPSIIGVVTSPTGAVIRDILHRLRDRFPTHVLVWPTAVQGEACPPGVIAGIEGFNALPEGGPIPRPDVIIVARGGGSLEDLWGFNDEGVARAAAASRIPLISAVGHEPDFTLIDFTADVRAPTPTAAAEMAVPVRTELLNDLAVRGSRLAQIVTRGFERRQLAFKSAERGLGRPEALLGPSEQRFDNAALGLRRALQLRLNAAQSRYSELAGRFGPGLVRHRAELRAQQLKTLSGRLGAAPARTVEKAIARSEAARLPRRALLQHVARNGEQLSVRTKTLRRLGSEKIEAAQTRLADRSRLLSSLSYMGVLERGFALVMDEGGKVVRRAGDAKDGDSVAIRFADGERAATLGKGPDTSRKAKAKPALTKAPQANLFDE